MRVSKAQAERNRARSVEVASRLFRRHGFDGIGVIDLMKEAGFTHGAFYGQFRSKGELVGEASGQALAEGAGKLQAVVDGADDPLPALVRYYLSCGHRDRPEEGCALVALSADAARQNSDVQARFTDGVAAHLDILANIVPEASRDDTADVPVTILSTMVGALLLARAVDDEQLSRRILDAAKDAILDLTGS